MVSKSYILSLKKFGYFFSFYWRNCFSFCNFIKLIKWRKIQYLNLNKALLFLRNQVICLKNWKLWRVPTTIEFNIVCWSFAHVSVLPMSTKMCSECFLFYLDLELLVSVSIKKPGLFWFWQITQILNKIKQIPHTLL